jgi:outer membrane lipoprotein-sorting protein
MCFDNRKDKPTIIEGEATIMTKSFQFRLSFIACLFCTLMGLSVRSALPQAMTADQIIEKNITARGGLKAWRDVKTMVMTGKMDAGSKQNVQLPFVMKLKRPRMSRLELDFAGKTAVQVYDGTRGWKVRPFMGRNEVESYTAAETALAAEESDLDGYLIDHAAKGIKVELADKEAVEGRDAYRMSLTMRNGQTRYLWVDAQSFLEVKIEGTPRKLDGKMHKVETYYRNYTSINGLMIPLVLETAVEKVQPTRKITFEKVVLNPKLEDNAFTKPMLPGITISGIPQPSTAQSRQPVNAQGENVAGEKRP